MTKWGWTQEHFCRAELLSSHIDQIQATLTVLQAVQKPSRSSLQPKVSNRARSQPWCNDKGYDTTIHPIVKCVQFLEDLLALMVAKDSKDPFGNIRVARKALSKIRCALLTAPRPVTVCHVFAFFGVCFMDMHDVLPAAARCTTLLWRVNAV